MSEMLKVNVTDDIEFAYRDSGPPPNKEDYKTIIIIHGHTYHSGVFSVMFEQAHSHGYRFILPNRRLYPGSTPYTREEAEAFGPTRSTEEKTKVYLKQGQYLLLFVNSVIERHDLKNVALAGWSLGSGFVSAMVASIVGVSEAIQARLRDVVTGIVWWDPTATVHGVDDPPAGLWVPLYDETLSPEERGPAFINWLAQYYPHKNMCKKDPYGLIYKVENPVKAPSFTGVSSEEILSMIEPTAGIKGDSHIPDKRFKPVNDAVRRLSFFDSGVRSKWGNVPFAVIYGEMCTYTIVRGAWMLEGGSKTAGIPLEVKSMPGANHFAMYDNPDLVFETFNTLFMSAANTGS